MQSNQDTMIYSNKRYYSSIVFAALLLLIVSCLTNAEQGAAGLTRRSLRRDDSRSNLFLHGGNNAKDAYPQVIESKKSSSPKGIDAKSGDGDEDHDSHEHDDDHDEDKKPWGAVILSTFLVNLATLCGVILLIPGFCRKSGDEGSSGKGSKLVSLIIPAFAAGALLATAFFLIIPEALLFMEKGGRMMEDEEEHHEESEDAAGNSTTTTRFLSEDGEEGEEHEEHEEHGFEFSSGTVAAFGCAIMMGFIFPYILGLLFPKDVTADQEEDTSESDFDDEKGAEEKPIDKRLISSIVIGDFFHNFCDGIFIGVAFMLCDTTTAVTIVAITFYHEVAQEIADFFLLTKHAGLSTKMALILNFAAGVSIIIGGLVVLGVNPSSTAIGVILSFASGVYLQIAASECLPRVDNAVESVKDRLIGFLFFALGAIPIGLALLNHQHCEGGHEDHEDEH